MSAGTGLSADPSAMSVLGGAMTLAVLALVGSLVVGVDVIGATGCCSFTTLVLQKDSIDELEFDEALDDV
ncbi:hypothetical protein KXD40_009720 [Peronospora effusa]|nr:hypothetical protein KXD40_009720 [Peronospora effusa]